MTVLLPPATLTERLRTALDAGRARSLGIGRPVLVSVSVPAPAVDPVRVFQAGSGERFLWERPGESISLVGTGSAIRIEARGPERFALVERRWQEQKAQAVVDQVQGCPITAPVCVGGFAFDAAGEHDPDWQAYADALMVVPRLLFVSLRGSSWLVLSALASPDRDPGAIAEALSGELWAMLEWSGDSREPAWGDVAYEDEVGRERWQSAVAAVVEDIRRGAVEKAVLARRLKARSERPIEVAAVLRRLRSEYGVHTVFAVALEDACFLGATPERLLRLEGRDLSADCLAGSARRGTSDEEDRSLGEALLADGKERHEHALVVEALREALSPVCSMLSAPETPGLLRMPSVQHLHTPLRGILSDGPGILELVERLHPTPAVGGVPRYEALGLIRRHEPFDRGWYAGPLGWTDGRGNGDFVAGIRSALVRGSEALLYAGCGIVAGSDPEREYEESCLKLAPMMGALDGRR